MRKVLYILTQLSDEDVEWLAGNGRREALETGHVLIRQGEANTPLIFVLEGEVSVTVKGAGEVARLGSGEILGEMSFVDRSPTSATVIALLPTQVLAIDRLLLTQQLQADPAFAARFYLAVAMYLSVRIRLSNQRLSGDRTDQDEELNMDMLDTVHIAGARFDRMIKSLLGT